MQSLPRDPVKSTSRREIIFEIGDAVCLIANPQWRGVVIARSLSSKVNVLWQNHGIEQIDSRLLMLSSK
jgi:hypothetical protein